jgi:branched-chain amino acid transport system substrate-binding protein
MRSYTPKCLLAGASFLLLAGTDAQADIKIAVAGPMSGDYLFFGEQMALGAELAVADINEAGGVLGQSVELNILDDACDPEQAKAVADLAVVSGMVFVAGHWCSSSSIPAGQIYGDAGILMITPASTNPKLTDEGGRNIFRQSGRDDKQGIVAGSYLVENWRDAKIAILHDGTTYGEGLASVTKAHMNSLGVQEAIYEAILPGQDDYSDVVTLLQASEIEVFYLGGYNTEAALLVKAARRMNYDAQMISGDALTSEEFVLLAGSAAEGTLFTFFPDSRQNPEAQEVVARFRDEGFEPEGYTLQTYAAIQAWSQAAEISGSLDLEAMISALQVSEFNTVIGTYRFDPNGDMTAPGFVWYVWEDGDYFPVK